MRSMDLEVLQKSLAEYVRLAASGETIRITDRGRVIAELTPPREDSKAGLQDAGWTRLVREGVLAPPTRRSIGPPPRKPALSHDALMEELRKSRGDA